MPVSTFISHTERECSLVIDSRIIHTSLMPTYNLIKAEWKVSLYVYPKTNGVLFLHKVGLSSEHRSANTFGNTSSDVCFVCALCSFWHRRQRMLTSGHKVCFSIHLPLNVHASQRRNTCKALAHYLQEDARAPLCVLLVCSIVIIKLCPGKVNHYNFVHTILGNNSLNQYPVSHYLGFVWHKSLQNNANGNC